MKTVDAIRATLQPKWVRTLRNSAKLSLCLWLVSIACVSSAPAHAIGEHPVVKAGEINPELIFRKSCSVCHGDRGNGRGRASSNLNPQPRDFTQSSNLTREAMINAVTYGRPGTAMMPWKTRYTDKQIEAVVDYVRNRFMLVALDPRIEMGRGVYGHFCQICHGDRAQGAVGTNKLDTPPDFTIPQAQVGMSRERMIEAVTHGKHGSTPAGFGDRLTPANIEAVVDYMRWVLLPELAQRDKDKPLATPASSAPQNVPPPPAGASQAPVAAAQAPSAAAPAPAVAAPVPSAAGTPAKQADMSLPFPKGLVGNIVAGRKFFLGNCSTCHGKLGNGEGPRAYFLNPKPRNFHDEYSHTNLNRPTLFSVITTGKPGTVMPAWGKVLSDQEIANVGEYVFETFVQEKAGAKADKK
ncbi:MAG: c-type cytochrome [Gallionellaceae bacterium]